MHRVCVCDVTCVRAENWIELFNGNRAIHSVSTVKAATFLLLEIFSLQEMNP